MSHPVVLLHGMWCTGASWNRVRGLLEPRGYRCHAPTLPGHDPVPDQPLQVARCGLTDYAGYLESYCAALTFERRPILIGHSMGALLAQQLAARLRPLALVLLTPAPHWGINGLCASNVVALAPWLLGGLFLRNPYKPSFERASRYFFNSVPVDRHRQLYEGLVHESGRALGEVAFWWANLARAAAVRSDDVRCPVYVVSCGEDRLTPAAIVRKVSAQYPQCAQRHYPERGHWVIDDEETEEMMHGICGWLRPIEQREGVAAHAR
jgi:pimeloyl-ACP methyl ester carboxylesterase